jgi:ATP-binding cassette subfamily B protein
VRQQGAGQFFGLVAEASTIESLALNGGVGALLAILEVSIAAAVLGSVAGLLPVLFLATSILFAGWIANRGLSKRRTWTGERLSMTHQLLENMVGNRTRLVQQPADQRHRREDEALNRYVDASTAMDRWELRLAALIPRGWIFIALVAVAPAAVAGVSPGRLAVSIGGVLLAYRGLRRLTVGLSDLAGAGLAASLVAPLARAASRRDTAPSPSFVIPPGKRQSADSVAVQAKDLVFRYRTGEPILRDCSLRIPRGARILLEGPSGSGKTTFASVLSGLHHPEAGMLLVDGLDRSVLGAAGWRSRVAMSPQPHDNYLISGSLAFNLLMGRRWPAQEAEFADAEQVCRELGLGDLLDRMPAGLHQVVGETGWQLSQGERTRVFLARALLQRPELLVLDESFSALDPENAERSLRCVLQRAPTVLAIAHS